MVAEVTAAARVVVGRAAVMAAEKEAARVEERVAAMAAAARAVARAVAAKAVEYFFWSGTVIFP